MLGFVSVNDPNAADAAYKPSDVAPGDAAGLALATANMQQLQRARSQWIAGVDNSTVVMLAVALLAIVAVIGRRE